MRLAPLLLSAIILSVACNKKAAQSPVTNPNSGVVTATVNGRQWAAQSVTAEANGKHIYITITRYGSESLYLKNVDPHVPSERIMSYAQTTANGSIASWPDSVCSSLFTLDGGDVSLDNYEANDSIADNRIFIDSYNTATGDISGSLTLTMYRESIGKRAAMPGYDDTMHISATFATKVQ